MTKDNKNKKVIRVAKRPYIAFGVMFGSLEVFGIIAVIMGIYKYKTFDLNDIELLITPLIPLAISYFAFWFHKIEYDDETIYYRGLIYRDRVKIKDIKRCEVRSETPEELLRPYFGLYIDTINKRSAIILSIMLYDPKDLNELEEHIEKINKNAKCKAKVKNSIFKTYNKK